jgi:hypothetical protein
VALTAILRIREQVYFAVVTAPTEGTAAEGALAVHARGDVSVAERHAEPILRARLATHVGAPESRKGVADARSLTEFPEFPARATSAVHFGGIDQE